MSRSKEVGLIKTPHFDYSLDISLDGNDTSEAIWHREITNIKGTEPDSLGGIWSRLCKRF